MNMMTILKAFFACIVLTVCPAVWAAIEFPIPDSVQSWEIPEMATNGVKAVWIEGVPWFGKPIIRCLRVQWLRRKFPALCWYMVDGERPLTPG